MPLIASVDVCGIEHIPLTGPALLIANHISNVDPFCLVAYIPRHFHGMAKQGLFRHPLSNVILSGFEPIRVRRDGGDRRALREAEQYLRQGALVMVFAEGTRSKTGDMQEARAGGVFLAQRTGAPIVPIAFSGTNRIFKKRFPWYSRCRVRMRVGEPFFLADLNDTAHHNRHDLAQAVMARVSRLLPPT